MNRTFNVLPSSVVYNVSKYESVARWSVKLFPIEYENVCWSVNNPGKSVEVREVLDICPNTGNRSLVLNRFVDWSRDWNWKMFQIIPIRFKISFIVVRGIETDFKSCNDKN